MDMSMFVGLVNNVALLMALGLLYDILALRRRMENRWVQEFLTGIILGAIGIAVMLTSWKLEPGIVFDTRSVLLGVSGMFFGGVSTLVTMLIVSALRLYQGGAGAWTGVMVIFTSGCTGILWRHLRRGELKNISGRELYLFGMLVHIFMLLCMLTLPKPQVWKVLSTISLPVLLIYPVGTMLLGQLLARRLARKYAEIALHKSEERYRTTLMSIGDGVVSVDAANRVEFLNSVAEQMTGWSQDEARGEPLTNVFRIVHEKTRQPVENPVEIILRTGEIMGLSNHTLLTARNGSECPIADSAAPIKNEEGEIVGAVLVFRDQTQERAALKALRESEERWQFALEGPGDGVWDWNYQTNQVFFSRQWKSMLGFGEGEIGDTFEEWEKRLYPEDKAKAYAELERHFSGETPVYRSEQRLKCKDGSYKWILDRGKTVSRTPDGKPLRVIGTHTDITERKQAEQERKATVDLLSLINSTDDFRETIQSLLAYLKDLVGCESVGIRLREGDDFPYYETTGLPNQFLLKDTHLCSGKTNAEVEPDSSDNPVLGCICGDVICGRFNPDKPFFTAQGSFWTNSITELLASAPEIDRPARIYNRCNEEGYESVALIPLHSGKQTLGLIQFNDREKGRFSPASIAMFERLANNIANFLAKKQVEKELQTSRERFRTLYEYSAVPIWEEDFSAVKAFFDRLRAEGTSNFRSYFEDHPESVVHCVGLVKILDVNLESLRFFGAGSKEELTVRLSEYFEDASLDIFREELITLAEGQTHFTSEVPIRALTGVRKYLSLHLSVVPGCEDTLAQVLVSFGDLTERKRAEEELRQTKEQLEAILLAIADGVTVLDAKGGLYYVNDVAARDAGYASTQEMLERTADPTSTAQYDLVNEMGAPFPEEQLPHRLALQGKPAQPITVGFRSKATQATRWSVVKTRPILDEQGQAQFVVTVTSDITERKQAEEQIKVALREKEVLLRELYHRTKNNMQVISSMLVLQSAEIEEDEKVHWLVQEINNKIQAMALVHQMLYQSQNLSSINLQIYIQELAKLTLTSYGRTASQVTLKLNLEPVLVAIDIATPLGMILSELLSNVCKHAFPGDRAGEIRISLSRKEADLIYLEFSDNGVGVPAGLDLRSQTTFGLWSVFGLAEGQLSGQVQVDTSHGLAYRIQFPDRLYQPRL